MRTLLRNIGQIAGPAASDKAAGEILARLDVRTHTDILIEDGIIADFLPEGTICDADEVVDCRGQVVLPAFVDSHTHIPFAGGRSDEFNRRLQGAGYMEIAASGGGINATVRATRETSEDELYACAAEDLIRLMAHGTATMEMKSGYGLDTKTELKQLRVIRRLQESFPADIKATFLGAHEVPPEYRGRTEEYVTLVIEEMLPAVRQQGIAEYCDIFCEQGVFSIRQSRRIMTRALELGFKLRFHADEIAALGGAELAADLGASSADHLVRISKQGIQKTAASATVCTLLPGTTFFLLSDDYAPARDIIEAGGIIALSTDLNPGSSYTHSMQMIITLACLKMGLTIEEAINGATINGAYSLGMSEVTGSLHPGKQADVILFDAPSYHYLVYNFGVQRITGLLKCGRLVYPQTGDDRRSNYETPAD